MTPTYLNFLSGVGVRAFRPKNMSMSSRCMTSTHISGLSQILQSHHSPPTRAPWNLTNRLLSTSKETKHVEYVVNNVPIDRQEKVDGTDSGKPGANENKLDAKDVKSKLKLMWKKYGITFIGTYLGIYALTLSSIFFSLDLQLLIPSSVGFEPVAAVHKVRSLVSSVYPHPARICGVCICGVDMLVGRSILIPCFISSSQVCEVFESVTGITSLPAYVKENPRG